MLIMQTLMAAVVNESVASLDSLHGAADGLDAKLQQSLAQQVRLLKLVCLDGIAHASFECACTCLLIQGGSCDPRRFQFLVIRQHRAP